MNSAEGSASTIPPLPRVSRVVISLPLNEEAAKTIDFEIAQGMCTLILEKIIQGMTDGVAPEDQVFALKDAECVYVQSDIPTPPAAEEKVTP